MASSKTGAASFWHVICLQCREKNVQTSAPTVYRGPTEDVVTFLFVPTTHYFLVRSEHWMMTDYLPNLEKEHWTCSFSDTDSVTVTWIDSLKRWFLLLEQPDYDTSEIIRFKSFQPTLFFFFKCLKTCHLDGMCWNLRFLHPRIKRLKFALLKQNITSWNAPFFDCGTPGVGLIAAFGTTTRAAPNYQHSCCCTAGYLSSGHA